MAINLTVVIDNDEAIRKFRELQKTAKTVTSSVVTDADRMDASLHKFAATLGQLGVGVSLIGLAKQIAQTRGEFQQLEVAFTTLLQSKGKADALMAQMVDLAAKTPFNLQGVADGARQLLAYGFAVEDITDTLTRLGNVAAGLGLPLDRLTYLYGTTAVQGRLYARDMLQFTSSGIPVLQEMAKMYGVTTEEINKMVSAGKIGFEDVKKVIENMTNAGGQFYNLMENQSKTITGLISNLGDAIDTMFNDIGKSQEGVITNVLKGTISLVENYQKVLNILVPLVATYGAYKAAIILTAAAEKTIAAVSTIQRIYQLAKGIETAAQAQRVFNTAVKANTFGLVLSAITGIVTAFAMFSEKAKTTTEIVTGLQATTQDYVKNAGKIDALADEYDTLSAKTQRTKEENERLAEVMQQLANVVPNAVSGFDEYGKVLGISIDKVRNFSEEHKDALRRSLTLQVDEAKKQIEELDRQFAAAKLIYENQTYARHKTMTVGGQLVVTEEFEEIPYSQNEINDAIRKADSLVIERAKLVQQIADTQKALSGLNTDVIAGQNEQASVLIKISDITSEITGKMSELNALQSQTQWSAQEKERIKTLSDEIKKLQGDYESLTGQKWGGSNKGLQQLSEDALKKELQARRELYDEETALKRKQITDEIELIQFDLAQTLAAIDKEKNAYIELQRQSGKSDEEVDTSTFDRRREIARASAELETEEVRKKRLATQQEEFDTLLAKYVDYEQRRTQITREYETDRQKLVENADGSNTSAVLAALVELDKQKNKALKAIEDEQVDALMQDSSLFVELFSDAADKSIGELHRVIEETDALLAYLQGIDGATLPVGFTSEQLNSLKNSPEAIQAVSDALKRLKGELGDRSPFIDFGDSIDELFRKFREGGGKDLGGLVGGIGTAVQGILPTIEQFGTDLGTIFGDSSIGENISIITDMLSGLGTAAQGVGQIMSGDILGGVTSIVSGVASIFEMANEAAERHKEAIQAVMDAKIAQQREYNQLLLEQNLLYEQGTTFFGTDEYGKAVNAIKVAKDAQAELDKALGGTDAQKRQQNIRNDVIGGLFGRLPSNAEQLEKYAGIANIQVVTGHRKTGLFGWGKGEDVYSSLLDVYPDLIDANGELNIELAKTILNTQNMSETDKEALQGMITYAEQAKEAMEAMADYLGGIFGELGNTITDALVDAFRNGTDAAESFTDSVSRMLEQLASDMIQSIYIAPILQKAQKNAEELWANEDLTDEERFAGMTGIVKGITDDAIKVQKDIDSLLEWMRDYASGKGFDIFQPDEESSRTSTAQGIAQASQESIDLLSGTMTAVQGTVFGINDRLTAMAENGRALLAHSGEIKENMSAMRDLAYQSNIYLSSIQENTSYCRLLDSMRIDMHNMKSSLDTIVNRGIIMRN